MPGTVRAAILCNQHTQTRMMLHSMLINSSFAVRTRRAVVHRRLCKHVQVSIRESFTCTWVCGLVGRVNEYIEISVFIGQASGHEPESTCSISQTFFKQGKARHNKICAAVYPQTYASLEGASRQVPWISQGDGHAKAPGEKTARDRA